MTKDVFAFKIAPTFAVYNWIMQTFDWNLIWVCIVLDLAINTWWYMKKNKS